MPDGNDVEPPAPPTSSEPIAPQPERSVENRARDEDKYDPELLYRKFVQSGGSIKAMFMKNEPGMPRSMRTLTTYCKKYRWRERLESELEKESNGEGPAVPMPSDMKAKRLERLEKLEDALFEMLTPREEEGKKVWPIPPGKFEAVLDKFLKLLERIELMSGGVTSRAEVRQIVQVNINIVCKVFGLVVNDIVKEGLITHKVARVIVDRFQQKIGSQQVVLESDTTNGSNLVEKGREAAD